MTSAKANSAKLRTGALRKGTNEQFRQRGRLPRGGRGEGAEPGGQREGRLQRHHARSLPSPMAFSRLPCSSVSLKDESARSSPLPPGPRVLPLAWFSCLRTWALLWVCLLPVSLSRLLSFPCHFSLPRLVSISNNPWMFPLECWAFSRSIYLSTAGLASHPQVPRGLADLTHLFCPCHQVLTPPGCTQAPATAVSICNCLRSISSPCCLCRP